MFIELIDGEKRTLLNLNTSTRLDLEISYSNSSLYCVAVTGTPAFGKKLYEGYKSGAENLYNKLRNQWVGSEYVEVIRK